MLARTEGGLRLVERHSVMWGMVNVVLPLKALERAAKAVGADKITGEAVYNAMFTGTMTSKDLLGLTGDLTYAKDAPFPNQTRVRVGTVKDGKHQLATPDWVLAPDVPKW